MIKKTLNGLLISAGYSRRMEQFKPLMLYKNKSFVETIVEKLLTVCEKVIVVTGFKSDEVESVCSSQFADRVDCVFNPNFESGMFTSLQTGLTELKDSDWVIYHFVDQPFHEEKFYNELVKQIDDKFDWIQPCYKGKEGHPVIFNKKVIEIIAESPLDSNLRMIRDLPIVRKNYWDCSYPKVLIDIDTPDDLKKIKN